MEIIYMSVEDLVPYEKNPRRNDDAVDYVANSIKEFGFKVPIVIDKDNVIVTGHTRLKASKKLGLKEVPCIRADDLTDEQVKAFRLADNSVSEIAKWDIDLLSQEIEEMTTFDFTDFGFEIEDDPIDTLPDDDFVYGQERERTGRAYNLDKVNLERLTDDFWQMPIISKTDFVPDDLIGFNYAKTSDNKNAGVHFFIDDYQFERIWTNPDTYDQILLDYKCVLTPDFSLYANMPMPLKIWNVYRSRVLGAYWQSVGMVVIPTVSWAEEATYDFAFLGIEKKSVVAVSTIGVKKNSDALKVWKSGYDEMVRRLKPSTVLVYGGQIEHDFKAKTVFYENKVTSNWKGRADNEAREIRGTAER